MDNRQRHRMRQVLLLCGAAAALGLLLLAGSLWLNRGIPCPFFRITGLRCPACGMTRAVAALALGDLRGALGYNLMSLPALALLLVLCITQAVRYIRYGACFLRHWERGLYLGAAVVLLCWMAVRNIWHI